jgi:hypothetical protein
VIPTQHKAKLPKSQSYPIGAEAISEALTDAPHVGSLTLSFRAWSATALQRFLRQESPYPVLAVKYQPEWRPNYGTCYDEEWHLTVHAVPRESRSVIARLLREQGMPAVAPWLRSSEGAGWCARSHRLELVFSPADETLTARHDDNP